MPSELPSLPLLAAKLRNGTSSAGAVTAACVAAHEANDLGAYKTWNGARAAEVASHVDGLIAAGYDTGPLMGVPCSVKDLFGIPGLPVFAGTDREFPADWRRAGPVAAALLAQLAIVMGKSHTVEMAFGGLGTNPHWPVPRNPWGGGDRVPGGSSSGAGVSLAEGSALLALGTDTAGSVRIPAALTGNVGLKITHGRWPLDGIVPLSPSFDSPGLLARTAEDVAFAFTALDPARPRIPDIPLSGLRIGVLGGVAAEDVDDDIATAVRDALGRIERTGATLRDAGLAHAAPALDLFRQGGLAASELAAFLQAQMPDRIARLDPTVQARIDGAEALSAADYVRRKSDFDRMAAATAAHGFDGFDLLACATVAVSPPRLADLGTPELYAQSNMAVLRNTAIGNLLGLCAITLPVGLDRNGIPVGLMLIAPPRHEEILLGAAIAAERLLDRLPRPPRQNLT